jgi:DNA mismatch repair protein MutS
MSENSIVIEYFDYHEKFEKKYGKDKSIVLMQVGMFYETYSTNERGPSLTNLSEILNIVYTRKNTNIDKVDIKNPLLLGFPVASATKYTNMLIEAGLTVIVIDQVSPPPMVTREITNIYSPGTYIEGAKTADTNYIVSIYIEEEVQKNGSSLICAGLAAADLTTGKCYVHEAYSNQFDTKLALDEVVRFVNGLSPKEIILYNIKKQKGMDKDQLISYLELDNKMYHYKEIIDKKYSKLSYQNEFLKNVYKESGMVSPIEYLDLNRYIYAVISFVTLLDFAYEHNQKIINNINKPSMYMDSSHLILGNNAIYQLNIVESDVYQYMQGSKIKSLLSVVDNTSTSLGKRLLKDKLMSPIVSHDELNKLYNYTDELIKKKNYIMLESILSGIADIERLERKLSLCMLHPYELFTLVQSYMNVEKVIKYLNKANILKSTIPSKQFSDQISAFIKKCNKTFKVDELKKYNLNDLSESFYQQNVYPEIDKLQESIETGMNFMTELCRELSKLIPDSKVKKVTTTEKITVKQNDRDGHYLSLTKIRTTALIKKLDKLESVKVNNYELDPKKLVFKEQAKGPTKIFFPDLQQKSEEMGDIKEKLCKLMKTSYIKELNDIYTDYKQMFKNCNNFISIIDLVKSNAKTACINNYVRPVIEYDENKSFFDAVNLRHPIIEKLIEHEYVPHSTGIGNELKGMLVFGLNSAGKSSFMKAVGLSIVMAQAGLFVPAEKFTFSPYKSLFTRITSNDNMFKGLSSFALEMVELKAILKRASPYSLIIGDEVCRGTEHISGNAIVATTIINLAKSLSSFIFATHLHEIPNLQRIKDLKNVKSFHLSVDYDAEADTLIYDRKLKEGSGESVYGITVAKHLIHDKDFIDMAIDIKNELTKSYDSMISGKKSRYNPEVYVYQCQICGCKDAKEHVSPLETHHINFQKDCKNGFVKNKSHIAQHSKQNLAVLCQKCHDKLHNNEISLDGYVQTTKGKKLIVRGKQTNADK